MRYDPLSKRLINIIYPLVIYMAIGMAVLGVFPNAGLLANLIEKLCCVAIMAILFYQDSKKIRWEGAPLTPIAIVILIGIGICACIGVNMLFELIGLTVLRSDDAKLVSQALYSDKLWLQILAVGIAAPIAEELLFRGILYRRMRTWLSVVPASMIAVAIFAAVHGNLLQALYAFLLGIILIWADEHFANLIAPILLHVSANVISIVVSQSNVVANFLQKYAVIACIVGVLGTVIGIVYLKKMTCSQSKNCI